MKRPPQRDPFGVHQREVTAQRRVGIAAKCTRCGESRPRALVPGSDPIICYSCRREERGYTIFDLHHPPGKANSRAKIPIWVNDHEAVLSVLQEDWPKKTLENPNGSPFRAGAARNRGYLETNAYLADQLLRENSELMEALDEYLEEKLGPRWWIGTPLENFAPKSRPKKRV